MADPLRIGIFGGTFDPPHVGHLILAEECRTQLHLDKLLWVVTDNPPHKQRIVVSPIEQRVALVKICIRDNPAFELSRVDIDRPAPHFAIDTVRILKEQLPEALMFYLMGETACTTCPPGGDPRTSSANATAWG